MPVIEHRLKSGRRDKTFTALCRDDKCPWKHRGVTCEATHIKAEEHVGRTGHAVTVYEECRTTIEAAHALENERACDPVLASMEARGDFGPRIRRERLLAALGSALGYISADAAEGDEQACRLMDELGPVLRDAR